MRSTSTLLACTVWVQLSGGGTGNGAVANDVMHTVFVAVATAMGSEGTVAATEAGAIPPTAGGCSVKWLGKTAAATSPLTDDGSAFECCTVVAGECRDRLRADEDVEDDDRLRRTFADFRLLDDALDAIAAADVEVEADDDDDDVDG